MWWFICIKCNREAEDVAMNETTKGKFDNMEDGMLVCSIQQSLKMVPKKEFGVTVSTIEWKQCKITIIIGVKEMDIVKPCRTNLQVIEEAFKSGLNV